jgi:ATP-binding cassette subfamily B protein
LENVNLLIKPGENVALVGPSGCGKTTICNLIPRFYDVTEGGILLDGINIKDITLRSLRSNIGVVQQDVYMFSGTVFENIAYGRPDASKEDVKRAAVLADADDFIMQLPEDMTPTAAREESSFRAAEAENFNCQSVFKESANPDS